MKKVALFLCIFFALSFVSAIDTFTVNNVIIKAALHQGENVVKTLTVTALSQSTFDVTIEGISGATLSGSSFSLGANEKKDITLSIDSATLEPGVYVGHISLKNAQETIDIPVILEIESSDVFFDLNLEIPPQYSEVAPGDRFIAQIKVFDLTGFKAAGSLGPSPVALSYELKSISGDTLALESENIIVDKQAQLTKTFVIPSSLPQGQYFFTATARHKTSVGTASYYLVVRSPFSQPANIFTPEFIAVLIAFGIFFLIIFAFIIYLVRDRNKLFGELYHFNSNEFRKHEHFLREQAKMLEQKGTPPKVVEREVTHKLRKLKASQDKRVATFKKLEQKGNVDEMKRKIALWKKEGYSTIGLERKVTGLSQKEMKKLMNDWKKKYKTEDYKNR